MGAYWGQIGWQIFLWHWRVVGSNQRWIKQQRGSTLWAASREQMAVSWRKTRGMISHNTMHHAHRQCKRYNWCLLFYYPFALVQTQEQFYKIWQISKPAFECGPIAFIWKIVSLFLIALNHIIIFEMQTACVFLLFPYCPYMSLLQLQLLSITAKNCSNFIWMFI